MGCDIHVVIEKKFGDKWIGLEELRPRPYYRFDLELQKHIGPEFSICRGRERNYDLFAALAGVRGDGPEPKGLPDDASELSSAVLGGDGDCHSHSWCTLDEYVENLLATVGSPAEIFLADKHPAVVDPYKYYFNMYAPDEDEEYRVVFAFDN